MNCCFLQTSLCSHTVRTDHSSHPHHLYRGVLHLNDDSYGMEPSDSAPDQHLVYRLQDVTSQPRGCGTPHDDEHDHDSNATEHAQYKPEEIHHRQHSRMKRAILHQTHYVELLLVVDNDQVVETNRTAPSYAVRPPPPPL